MREGGVSRLPDRRVPTMVYGRIDGLQIQRISTARDLCMLTPIFIYSNSPLLFHFQNTAGKCGNMAPFQLITFALAVVDRQLNTQWIDKIHRK